MSRYRYFQVGTISNHCQGDPAEPVDEAEYLDEVEREAREFFCHEHINILPVSDTVDINLTIRIPQMAHSRKQRGN